jgi:4'-phosphopantetheinyl transferase
VEQDCAGLWLDAPERPSLNRGEVHVWRGDLNLKGALLRQLNEVLSAHERLRADRFHFQKDRDHFVAARGGLREILARYTGVAPRSLCFSYGPHGKPSLSGETGGGRLCFNVSHSNGVALYTVTAGHPVGVDIECVREEFAGLELAERFFSAREVSALRALAPCERARAFFDC